MNNIEFYTETLKTFNNNKVKYLVVGGFAVNSYGYFRSTGDMDLWIDNNQNNLQKISEALILLNYKAIDIEKAMDELRNHKNISLIHNKFFKVELISFLSTTVKFKTAFLRKQIKSILGVDANIVTIDDLIELKIKSGREKDLHDVYELQKIKKQKH